MIYEERYYDPQTISNKFAVGERIEWVGSERYEGHNVIYTMEKGVIRHIRARVVIIDEELPDGTIRCWRVERFYLSKYIRDELLLEAVNAWEGTHLAPKSTTVPRQESNQPRTIYGLVDPRDETMFYIGVSVNPEMRYQQHLRCNDFNFKKNDRIRDILASNLQPSLVCLESGIVGIELAEQRETYWIQHYLSEGAPLTNFTKMNGASGRDFW